MPQSPELAAGAGFTFEDAVAATYLTALLQEGYAPGIESRIVSRVALQQRSFGEPLDDVIVDFRAADGGLARLSLQVKRSLTISQAETNTDFREVIRDSWSTLHKQDFRLGVDRYGAVVGEVAAARGRALRTLCELARASVEAVEFEARFEDDGNASQALKDIRTDVAALIEHASGAAPTAADLHRFFAHFVLIEFDYLHEGGTSQPAALNALRTCLATGHETDAPSAWAVICQIAREESAKSGVFGRDRLVLELSTRIRLAAAPSLRGDLDRIRSLTAQWLADIEDDVGGTRLERTSLVGKLQASLSRSRVVQIRGLPGSGKSVLLRRRVEMEQKVGPVLLLKSGRLDGAGWASFATANGLSAAPLESLLVNIAATGSNILYVDGIDRIEKQHQPIIRDVMQVILSSPFLTAWRIVVSLRDTGIEPLRNWLGDLLRPEGLGTVEVSGLDDAEAEILADTKPHLKSLLFGPDQIREIVRRPFFAKVLDQNFGSNAGDAAFQPQSEVDLIGNWWARGGYDAEDQAVVVRQRAIIELGALRARHLEREIAISQLSPAAVSVVRQFIVDGLLQEVRPGHSLRFAHDIFFEWAFFHVLVDCGEAWLDEIRACGEPPAIARVVELYSQSEFQQGAEWTATLHRIEVSRMRSQWTRAWLLAPLAAPDFMAGVRTFAAVVEGDGFRFLKKALVWFQAEKTTPNPEILARDLPNDERIRYADLLGWPSDFAAWQRFILFLLARVSTIPVALYPDVLSVFEVWQNAVGRWQNPVSNAILDQVAGWLAEMDRRDDEVASATEQPPHARWHDLGSNHKGFRGSLAGMILRFSAQRPDLAQAYLERVLISERLRSDTYSEIVSWSPTIAHSHPRLLVDLTLKHLKDELPRDQLAREREGLRQRAAFRKQVMAKPPGERTTHEQRFLDSPTFFDGPSFSYHDWQTLAVNRGTANFWPPSPIREPFHSLFAGAPKEALRLVRELSNHAITCWRQLHEVMHESPGTPLPLEIAFPWGTQSFWGGDREYLWHRGAWAPAPVACAYMALEEWSLAELGRGRQADELIQEIVVGNECIAILGAATVVALQAETISEPVFSLVTSQRLLTADYNRMLHDFTQRSVNLIGFRDKSDLPHYEGVKAGNERHVRRKSLQQLLIAYFLIGGAEFRERVRAAVLAFPDHLPYELEEHRNLPDARAQLSVQARELAELVDAANYQRMKVDGDDEKVAIVHVSPTASSPERVERAQEASRKLRENNLWIWANTYFEKGEIGNQFTVSDAITFAKEADTAELYSAHPPGNEAGQHDISMCQGAVAAVAALILAHRQDIASSDLNWARDVLARAMQTPERRDAFWSPMSIIPWHHGIFIAHGLAADLRHGTSGGKADQKLLMLVTHPLECVSLAALQDALALWDVAPSLGWMALFVSFSLCHIHPRQPIGPNAPIHTPEEIRDALQAVERHYREPKEYPDLPLPPKAWVKIKQDRHHRRSVIEDDVVDGEDVLDPGETWGEPPVHWYSQYAAKLLAAIPIDKVITSEAGPAFLSFLSGLLTWTMEKISPPWLKPGRRDRDSGRLHEWTHEFGRVLGKVAGFLPLDQMKELFLDPVFTLEGERCWDLLKPLVDTYICAHVYDAKQVPAEAPALLQLCLERVLEAPAFNPSSYHAGELYNFDLPSLADALMFVSVEHAGGAARYANGDWSEIGRILPIIDRFVRAAGWAHSIMSRYLTLCGRAKASYPADSFADQTLDVINRQADQLKGWHGTALPARIAGLVQHFAHRETPMPLPLGQKLLRILDLLVDMGDRRSAALQLSESFREIQTG